MTDEVSTVFVLDANVFIQAHRLYYARDLCPGFWECLEYYCQKPRLLSIDRVKKEIKEGDALYKWVRQAPDSLFVSTEDQSVGQAFKDIQTWAKDDKQQFTSEAKSKFARVADGWLVAYAKVHGFSVVTLEVRSDEKISKVKIPNVCAAFKVPYMDTFSMLRSLEVRFNWHSD